MRLLEVGTKQWSLHEEMLAQDFFQRAYELIVLFVSINQQVLPPKALSEFEPDVFQELQQYLENFDAHCQSVAPKMVTAKVMPFKDLNEFVAKVDSLKKQNRLDLSSDQDLILGIMNLINLEEEFFELGAKTKNAKYYVLLFKVREMRKHFLQIVIKNYEGEVWCISKHLLAAAMRCMQAGFKLDEALLKSELFQSAYDLYSLFWGLNLGVVGNSSLAKPQGFLGKLGSLVKKAIDCCIE